jgi:photosystem II stability/assembly factor-like uncharacterized protein
MKNTHRFISVIFAVSTLAPLRSFSQLKWEKCGSFKDRISSIYFYDNELGFIAIGVPAGPNPVTPAIYRTSDGGKTWGLTNTPNARSNGVNDIFMENKLEGWATGDQTTGMAWHTSDGGETWNATWGFGNGNHIGNSIRKSVHGILLSDFLGGEIDLSTDKGATFHKVYHTPNSDYMLGMDFSDSVHGVAVTTFQSGNKWSYTDDGGLSWHPSNYNMESWSIRAMKGTSMFFATPEGLSNTDNYLSEVMRSDDYGKSWKKIRNLPFRTTSDIEVSGKALYVQTGYIGCTDCSFPDGKGIYCSTDSGVTWHGLGGPEYWSDNRFAVIQSCYGTTIFCADRNYNVYRAVDTTSAMVTSRDGPQHTKISPPASIIIDGCYSGYGNAVIKTDDCYTLVLENEKIDAPFSSLFSLSDSQFPVIISGKEHTITITSLSGIDSGTYDTHLHVTGYYDYGPFGTTRFDTLLPMHVIVTPVMPKLAADKNAVIFTTVTPCTAGHDETLTLRNAGCDTLTVISGPGQLLPQFSFDSLSFPMVLGPDESKILRFHFIPDSIRLFTSVLRFKAVSHGRMQELDVPIQGENAIVVPQLELSTSMLSFQMYSLCDFPQEKPVSLRNSGCDTIRIVSLRSQLMPEYTFDSILLPLTLAPNESANIMVHFHAMKPGSYLSSMIFTAENGYTRRIDSLDLVGMAQVRAPEFSTSDLTINLPLISTCESPFDTAITVFNSGCDTLNIISGPGIFPGEFMMDSVTLPIKLTPHESFTFHFHFHPSGSGVFSAHPEFVAERFGSMTTLSFSLTAKGEEGSGLLRTTPQSFSFSPMTICSIPDSLEGIIQNPGCDTLIVSDVTISESTGITRSALTLPAFLPPQSTLPFIIYFNPKTKGTFNALATINGYSAHGSMVRYTNIIPITTEVGDGTKTLSINPSEISFGSRTLCSAPDTAIIVTNSGCDTLSLNSATFNGTGFKLHDVLFPIILFPGKSASITLFAELDTTGKRLFSDASLIFDGNSDNSLAPIRLHQSYNYPAQYEVLFSEGAHSGAPGDTVQFEIRTNEQLHDLQTLDLDLTYNTDLLGFVKAEGPNNIIYSAEHLHISGKPYLHCDAGVLGTVIFQVYLTKEISTDLAFSNAHLNLSDPAFEECVATASVIGKPAVFISSYSCGGKTISNFLGNTSSFKVTSAEPNPTADAMTINLDSKMQQEIYITVFDALGRQQLQKNVSVASGHYPIPLDLSKASNGMYVIKIANDKSNSMLHIIKRN